MLDASKKTILLVEDDQFLAMLLKNRLQKEEFAVTLVGDGNAALRALADTSPDLLLLDIILPGPSGFEILEKLRKSDATKQLPIMIISNLGQDEDVEYGTAAGVVDYFIKARTPIETIIERVGAYLANPAEYKKHY